MKVIGPDWPSTRALQAQLAQVAPLDLTLQWGRRTHDGFGQLCAFAMLGVPCPLATDSLEEAQTFIKRGDGNLWGRKGYHTQGTDIVGSGFSQRRRGLVERWNERWLLSDFWVEPIDGEAEFRQHIWDGQCIRIGKKIQTGPPTRVLPVRSRRNGWTIDYGAAPEEPLRSRLREVARGAVAALGLVGGAVDLIQSVAGEVYALEVNTAPSLRDAQTLSAYVKALTRWGQRRARTETTGAYPH